MNSLPIHSPHDRLFKAVFSNKHVAEAFLKGYLPESMAHALNWDSLALERDTFVDETLKELQSDLLYKVEDEDTPAFLYLLWEHRSSPCHWMALRIYEYRLKIWMQYRQSHPSMKMLPPIYSLVLYHGEQSWKGPESMRGLLDISSNAPEAVVVQQPSIQFQLGSTQK